MSSKFAPASVSVTGEMTPALGLLPVFDLPEAPANVVGLAASGAATPMFGRHGITVFALQAKPKKSRRKR